LHSLLLTIIIYKIACITAEQASTTNVEWPAAEKPVTNRNKHALPLNNQQLQNKHAMLLNNPQLLKLSDIAVEKSSTT